MDAESPKEDSPSAGQPAAAAPQPKAKKPSQALYVPKKQQQQQQGSRDKAQSAEGTKPRPRPRYTDKNRKNVKNRKDKAAAAAAALQDGEVNNGEAEGPHPAEAQPTSDSSCPAEDAAAQLDAASPPEEQGAAESWDAMFDDDGDCLDPHLLEEVRARPRSSLKAQWNMCHY